MNKKEIGLKRIKSKQQDESRRQTSENQQQTAQISNSESIDSNLTRPQIMLEAFDTTKQINALSELKDKNALSKFKKKNTINGGSGLPSQKSIQLDEDHIVHKAVTMKEKSQIDVIGQSKNHFKKIFGSDQS